MYDELVKRLRDKAGAFDYDGRPDIACDYEQASDAIEELSKLANAIPHKCECCIGCEIEQKNGGCDNGFVLSPKRAMNYIKELSKPRWIPVTERLPESGQEVLCKCLEGIYDVFKYINGISGPWYKDSRHVYRNGFVTHWMPLPEPPKEEI